MLHEELPVPATGAVAPSCASELPAIVPKRTLLEIASQLWHADDALADPNFDPAAFVQELRSKVDDISLIVDRMESVGAWLKDVAAPLLKKGQAILNNRERLRDYVVHVLLIEKMARVETGESTEEISFPGHVLKVRLRDSNPSLVIDRAATADDFEKFPEHVKMNRSYSWDNDRIKDELKADAERNEGDPAKLPEGIPARLTIGNWPEWVPNVPQQLERKKKGKKKT